MAAQNQTIAQMASALSSAVRKQAREIRIMERKLARLETAKAPKVARAPKAAKVVAEKAPRVARTPKTARVARVAKVAKAPVAKATKGVKSKAPVKAAPKAKAGKKDDFLL